MELKDCLSVGLQARQSAVTQWSVYFGLITFVIGSLVLGKDPVALTIPQKVLGTVAFVLFDAVNLRGLVEVYRLLYAMAEEAKAAAVEAPPRNANVRVMIQQLNVGSRVAITSVVHVVIGVSVLAVIWSDTLRNGSRMFRP